MVVVLHDVYAVFGVTDSVCVATYLDILPRRSHFVRRFTTSNDAIHVPPTGARPAAAAGRTGTKSNDLSTYR
jgi:hypothetical protein